MFMSDSHEYSFVWIEKHVRSSAPLCYHKELRSFWSDKQSGNNSVYHQYTDQC